MFTAYEHGFRRTRKIQIDSGVGGVAKSVPYHCRFAESGYLSVDILCPFFFPASLVCWKDKIRLVIVAQFVAVVSAVGTKAVVRCCLEIG
jgi:hypothetical protein